MKYFLAKFNLINGDHEHRTFLVIAADNEERAKKWAERQAFSAMQFETGSIFIKDRQDEELACEFESIGRIKKQVAELLPKIGVCPNIHSI